MVFSFCGFSHFKCKDKLNFWHALEPPPFYRSSMTFWTATCLATSPTSPMSLALSTTSTTWPPACQRTWITITHSSRSQTLGGIPFSKTYFMSPNAAAKFTVKARKCIRNIPKSSRNLEALILNMSLLRQRPLGNAIYGVKYCSGNILSWKTAVFTFKMADTHGNLSCIEEKKC